MKIALFTTGIYPYITGGMQKHSYYLAKYLAKNKIHVDLYHYVPYDKTLVEDLEGFSETEVEYIDNFCFHFDKPKKYPGHYILESYSLSKKFYNFFLETKDEINFVYAQGFSGWYYAKQKYRGKKLPQIGVNFHGLEMFQRAPSIKSKIEQLMFRYPVQRCMLYSDYIYSLGGKLTNILIDLGFNGNKIIEQPIGISSSWLMLDDYSIEIKNNRKFVFLGRYEARKGIKELSIILRDLVESFDFEFHFIGPIPENMKLVHDKIFYHGLIKGENSIKSILRKSDILVIPSYSEGMPTVILEAMASGCAIVATDVGAVREQVGKDNGWLVNPGDIVSLRNNMVHAINCSQKELLDKKNQSIIKIKENFLWNDVINKVIRKITKCL